MAQRAWAAALLWIHVDMNSYLLLQLRYNVLSFGSFFFLLFSDQATVGLMKTPRCSLPDVSETEATTQGRRKRSVIVQNKWNKRHLSWR